MKYVPGLHENVVKNMRELASKEGVDTSNVTDAMIWTLFEGSQGSTQDESREWFLESLTYYITANPV